MYDDADLKTLSPYFAVERVDLRENVYIEPILDSQTEL